MIKWTCILLVILLISCGSPVRQEAGFVSIKGDTGFLFEQGVKDAVLRNFIDDTTYNVTIIRYREHRWDTIFSQTVPTFVPADVFQGVEIKDFNGDHIPDLKIVKFTYQIHPADVCELWLYQHGQFRKVAGFDKIPSPEYVEKTGLIYGYQSAGCGDMAMMMGTYRIVADTVQTIQYMRCDCCDKDSCTISIEGANPYKVPKLKGCEHVPEIYADLVKWKCEL